MIRQSAAELRRENATLRAALKETLWMARRYADGRMTFAVSDYNRAVRDLLALGLPVHEWDGLRADGTVWARDGMGRLFDRLTDEQAAAGKPPFRTWTDVADERELLARELSDALRCPPGGREAGTLA